jgi:hypothetical protein
MSKEKKANVDTGGLGRLMGIYSHVNGGVFIVMGVLQALGLKQFRRQLLYFLLFQQFIY